MYPSCKADPRATQLASDQALVTAINKPFSEEQLVGHLKLLIPGPLSGNFQRRDQKLEANTFLVP